MYLWRRVVIVERGPKQAWCCSRWEVGFKLKCICDRVSIIQVNAEMREIGRKHNCKKWIFDGCFTGMSFSEM
jgi:hypothetical protein